jgi:hypothetical protein
MITAPAPRQQSRATCSPNGVRVEHWERKHRVDVTRGGFIVGIDDAEPFPGRSRERLPDKRAHRFSLGGVEEQAGRPDALECVPLDRVVAGRDHQTASGVVMLDSELARRRGRKPEVDHACADRLECGYDTGGTLALTPDCLDRRQPVCCCLLRSPMRRTPRRTWSPPPA